jgi:hypothetical protein
MLPVSRNHMTGRLAALKRVDPAIELVMLFGSAARSRAIGRQFTRRRQQPTKGEDPGPATPWWALEAPLADSVTASRATDYSRLTLTRACGIRGLGRLSLTFCMVGCGGPVWIQGCNPPPSTCASPVSPGPNPARCWCALVVFAARASSRHRPRARIAGAARLLPREHPCRPFMRAGLVTLQCRWAGRAVLARLVRFGQSPS